MFIQQLLDNPRENKSISSVNYHIFHYFTFSSAQLLLGKRFVLEYTLFAYFQIHNP